MTSGRFSGHQSFPFRNTWLTKGATACAENPAIFSEDDALVTLGVGKNMVYSIKFWCLATGVLEVDPDVKNNRGSVLRPTAIGRKLFIENGGWDPYLEDTGTLWLLHYLLATNAECATTVYYAFNEMPSLEFTRMGLERALFRLASELGARATTNTIKRDVSVLIRSYVQSNDDATTPVEDSLDCPLAELGLVYEDPTKMMYRFSRGPKDSLPDAVVLFSAWNYAQHLSGQRALTFDELAYRPLSPGRVLKLDEVALAERLERLTELTSGAWQLTETAGYRQILMREEVEPIRVLHDRYTARSEAPWP